MSIRHVLPTPWLSIQFTPYLIDGKIIQMVLGLILILYCMASKTWLKNALHFAFWDRIFARVHFNRSSFFILSFRHQDSNSHYLVVATAKIPKICKRTFLDVYFLICKSQDRAINRQWIIQPKLIDCPSDTFFNFVIPQQICLIPLKVFKNWTRMNKNVDWVQKRSQNSLRHLRCRSLQQ